MRSLKSMFMWATMGRISYVLSQWIILIILARLGSTVAVGKYSYALAIAAPVFMLTNMQLRNVLATDASNRYSFAVYRYTRVVASAVGLLVVVLLSMFIGKGNHNVRLLIIAVAVSKGIEGVGDIYLGLYQSRERLDIVFWSLLYRSVAMILFVYLLYSVFREVVFVALGMLLAWSLVLVGYDFRVGKVLDITDDNARSHSVLIHDVVSLSKLAIPLGLANMMVSLNRSIPRYYIEMYRGAGELGIFTAISYSLVAGQIIGSAISQSFSARLARYRGYASSMYKSLLIKAVVVSGVIGLLGLAIAILVGKWALFHVYGAEYAEHSKLLLVVMVANVANMMFWPLGTALVVEGMNNMQFIIRAVAVAVMAVLCGGMVRYSGGIGAAWALVVVSVLQLALAVLALRRALCR